MKFVKIPDKDFEMSVYQTTQLEWQEHIGSTPSYFKGSGHLPVEKVSWNDVQELIFKMNFRKDGYMYRLPTEEEWEYCCRAGSTTDFCFGNSEEELEEYAWFCRNSDNKTHPVGQKKPNAFGLYDMHGNVWEWTDSLWSPSSSYRVLRGGSWVDFAQFLRSAGRDLGSPGGSDGGVGFRLVRTACIPVPSNTFTLSESNMSLNEVKQRMWKAYQAKAKREFLKMWNEIIKENK